MKGKDIKAGETYLFLATDSVDRKHLEGQPFTVVEIKPVWRRFKSKGTRKVNRYFNDDGVGARAEELEPLDPTVTMDFNSEPPRSVIQVVCSYCEWRGDPKDLVIDDTHAPDRVREVCPNCGESPDPF